MDACLKTTFSDRHLYYFKHLDLIPASPNVTESKLKSSSSMASALFLS
ncbi:hypothetical protein HMPREF9370_2080 [Neisseria wadsworthii 9715]|uniref:Uncharacterized protein n=1 Tax=Neisseria wadsworthii 9715 TaxID=1030841 RepID=G4CST9_9NEIS|nr:hypothetical protein HMPREF9370_2080 [Neisseria wadsworthii 9715]